MRSVEKKRPLCRVPAKPTRAGRAASLPDFGSSRQAKAELGYSEEEFRTIAEYSKVGITIVKDLKFVYVNPHVCQISGYSREELIGKPLAMVIHADSYGLADEKMAELLAGAPAVSCELRINAKSGEERWIEISTALRDIQGGPAFISAIVDVTERKKIEEALRESERHFRGIFENATIGLYRTTPDGRVLMANPTMMHMLGYSSFEEIAQRDLNKEGFEPESPRAAFMQRIESEGQVMGLESVWLMRDGSRVFARESAKAIRDGAGKTLYYEGTVEDITERRKAEAALKREKDFSELAINAMPGIFYVFDENGKILRWNKNLETVTGYSAEEIARQTAFDHLRKDYREIVAQKIGDVFSKGWTDVEVVIVSKAGKETPYYCQGFRLVMDGKPYIVGVGTDIAERKRSEQALMESEENYRQLFEAESDAIFLIENKPGRILQANDAACALYGYAREELLTLKNADLLAEPEETRRVMHAMPFEPERVVVIPLQHHRKKDGTVFPVEITGRFFMYHGKPVHLVTIRDITERKRAEAQILSNNEEIRETFRSSIRALSSAIEMRDPYTGGHQERVTKIACAIAREMGLSEEMIEGIQIAGIVHDIGKLGIPAEILSKPTKLLDIELSIIKSHAEVGYSILRQIRFPWPVAQIVHQHHERLDGTGYPNRLKGNDILQEAKIIAVADVVEAMSSHRPYRPALGISVALDEVSRYKGVLYDPAVVDACLKLFAENRLQLD